MLTITTAGGVLKFDFDDASYEYVSNKSDVNSPFSYTLVDNDGDTTTGLVTFTDQSVINGTAGDDTLTGTTGVDYIIGQGGNDTLTGDIEADVFKWNLNDDGAVGTPAADIVKDFSIAQGDALDLKDLLVGESAAGGNLEQFLHFEQTGGDTIVHVNLSLIHI